MRARAAEVSARIERAARRAGRDPAEVKLVAVSKTHPASLVREAAAVAGLSDLGENRVQEAEAKIAELKELSGLRWHLIGHLQPNKARRAARLFDLIHTVDGAALAERLERICADLGASPRGKKCAGMEGILEEGKELMQEKPEPPVLDAGMISAAQHVEHYEIAGYGTLRTWARQLGFTEHVELLQQTLDEEVQTDQLLSQIAESAVNAEAEEEEEAGQAR